MSMNRGINHGKQSVNLTLTVLGVSAPTFLLTAIGFAFVKLGSNAGRRSSPAC